MPSTLSAPAIDYCRTARRLRCRLVNDPIGKQQALAALARRADRAGPAVVIECVPDPAPDVDSDVRAFAKAVSTAMEGSILRFSRREELIRQAQALGIRRFDANLLIAAVQHRLGGERRIAEPMPKQRSIWRLVVPIGFAVATQGAIVFGCWRLFV